MGWSKEGLLDDLFRRWPERQCRVYDDYVGAAAQAIVT
jgi:hypothetical protein